MFSFPCRKNFLALAVNNWAKADIEGFFCLSQFCLIFLIFAKYFILDGRFTKNLLIFLTLITSVSNADNSK